MTNLENLRSEGGKGRERNETCKKKKNCWATEQVNIVFDQYTSHEQKDAYSEYMQEQKYQKGAKNKNLPAPLRYQSVVNITNQSMICPKIHRSPSSRIQEKTKKRFSLSQQRKQSH